MHRCVFASIAVSTAIVCLASAAEPDPTPGGHLPAGWELVANPPAPIAASCRVSGDGVIAVIGRPVGYLLLPGEHRNYRFHVEYRWPAGAVRDSNGGVLVNVASGPVDRNTWPVCFQVQAKVGHAGDLLPMAGARFAEPLSSPPGARTPVLNRAAAAVEKEPGNWNSVDVVCRDGSIFVSVNGIAANQVTHCVPDSGRIAIQLEGFPYELRHLSVEPLQPPTHD